MDRATTAGIAARLLLVVGLAAAVAGCDQLAESFDAATRAATPQETLRAARQALAAGRHQQAIDGAKHLASQPGALQVELALVVARAYAMQGDAAQALSHLRTAIDAGFGGAALLIADPAFAPMRTDMRFIALLAQPQPVQSTGAAPGEPAGWPPTPVSPGARGAVAPAVSAEVGSAGVSARAGPVSAQLAPEWP